MQAMQLLAKENKTLQTIVSEIKDDTMITLWLQPLNPLGKLKMGMMWE